MAIAEQTSPAASVAQVKQPKLDRQQLGSPAGDRGARRRAAAADARELAGRGPSHARDPGLRRHRLDDRSGRLCGLRGRHRRADGVSAGIFAQSGKSQGPDGHERGPDAGVQRLCQYRPRAGRVGAVSCRRHDGDRPRQADRAQHPVAGRRRDPQRRDRHDPGRLRDRVSGAVDHGARRLPRSDHARHHRGLRREQEGRLRQHADDHDGSDRQHLERRHQDRGGAEHGGHRLHREGIRQDDHVAGMADRGGAVRRPDVDRALFRDDPHDAAGSDAGPRRARGDPQVARRSRPDEGVGEEAAGDFAHAAGVLGDRGRAAQARYQHDDDHRGRAHVPARASAS